MLRIDACTDGHATLWRTSCDGCGPNEPLPVQTGDKSGPIRLALLTNTAEAGDLE